MFGTAFHAQGAEEENFPVMIGLYNARRLGFGKTRFPNGWLQGLLRRRFAVG